MRGHREDSAIEAGHLTGSGWAGESSLRGITGSAHSVVSKVLGGT